MDDLTPMQEHWYTLQPSSFLNGYDTAKNNLRPYYVSRRYDFIGLRRMRCAYLHGFRYGRA